MSHSWPSCSVFSREIPHLTVCFSFLGYHSCYTHTHTHTHTHTKGEPWNAKQFWNYGGGGGGGEGGGGRGNKWTKKWKYESTDTRSALCLSLCVYLSAHVRVCVWVCVILLHNPQTEQVTSSHSIIQFFISLTTQCLALIKPNIKIDSKTSSKSKFT